MSTQSLVDFDGVIKRFGSYVAVQRLDFDIRKGEFLAIMGSSGCGKTTTLRMLAGLEAPSEGQIRIGGKPVNDLPTWSRDTPMVWQSLALFPFLNVIENVEFGLKMRGVEPKERRARAEKWLDRMQIREFATRAISQLSGGQRQRVALARSLVVEPEILLLDEPLSALDAHLKVRMQSVLKNLQRETGITFVYVTHSQSEAFSMADRVIIMSRGRIEQIGTPQEIYSRPRTRFVAEFLGSSNILGGRLVQTGADRLVLEGGLGRFEVARPPGALPAAGEEITFSVPDSACDLSPVTAPAAVNAIAARVVGEEFEGSSATIHLEAANGQELRVRKSQSELSRMEWAAGGAVTVSWPADACHILQG